MRAEDRIGWSAATAPADHALRILAGLDLPDTGALHLRRGARVGYLRQEVSATSDRTVLAEAETALEPLRALEQRLRAIEEEIARDHEHVPDELASRYDDIATSSGARVASRPMPSCARRWSDWGSAPTSGSSLSPSSRAAG
jgi:ATPase subunit of ABC transporter with duplicated ATPase domains